MNDAGSEHIPSFSETLNTLCYQNLEWLGVFLLRAFYSFRVKNRSAIPSTGPFIVTANHSSFMDPVVLQAACPRRISFMMTEKYYKPLWSRWFFKMMRAIPLRDETLYNIAALREGLRMLGEGKVIGIFPEGGISPNGVIREGRPGTILLAEKSRTPLLPAFISGTHQALPRNAKFFRKARITVTFGELVTVEDLSQGIPDKEGLLKATQSLMQRIRELAPTA